MLLLQNRFTINSSNLSKSASQYLKNIHLSTTPNIKSNPRPTIFYSNHTTSIDWQLIINSFSLPSCKVVAVKIFESIFPNAKSTFIPVSSSQLTRHAQKELKALFQIYSMFENIPEDEGRIINLNVSKEAADSLSASQDVIIFPNAGIENHSWFPGIGFIIQEYIRNYKDQPLSLQPILIRKFDETQLLKARISASLHYPMKRQVEVIKMPLFPLERIILSTSDLPIKNAAKKTADILEKDYYDKTALLTIQ